jgi:glycosyltransferase involved in cell wall biosynthesis
LAVIFSVGGAFADDLSLATSLRGAPLKILFVGFPYSIHAARWTSLLQDTGWDIHFFPSQPSNALHENFSGITFWPIPEAPFENRSRANVKVGHLKEVNFAQGVGLSSESVHIARLARVMDREQFDVVHSLEFQHAGYLTCDAIDQIQGSPPIWIATNYGADIAFFGKEPKHQQKIQQILKRCDYYSSECTRDLELAQKLGFKGRVFTILPNSGGIDVLGVRRFRQAGKSSERRIIAVKGYQHFAGRALTALRALELCGASRLDGYHVKVFSAFPEVVTEVERLSRTGNFRITCLPEHVSHEEILSLHGSARISLAISLADGISTALLEAMAMGSFPIQTCTACADEWIVDGESGFIVSPDKPDEIAGKIAKALQDDGLIDRAAQLNEKTILDRAKASQVKGTVIEAYKALPTSLRGR